MVDVTTGSWKTFGKAKIYYGTTDTAERKYRRLKTCR